jgi:hypothetical protein
MINADLDLTHSQQKVLVDLFTYLKSSRAMMESQVAENHELDTRLNPLVVPPGRESDSLDAKNDRLNAEALVAPPGLESERSAGMKNYDRWEGWMDKEDIYTVMIRNIPCSCTREDIAEAIQQLQFHDKHDFFYVPTRHGKNRGFAFIGFPDPAVTRQFAKQMTGYRFPGRASPKVTTVVPANCQGFSENLKRFESTCVMSHENARPLFKRQP